MTATTPTAMQAYQEGKREGELPWQLKACIITLHHHDDGASHRVIADKLGLDEATVGEVLKEAKTRAQSDLFMDQLNTLDQQAKDGSETSVTVLPRNIVLTSRLSEATQFKPRPRQRAQ